MCRIVIDVSLVIATQLHHHHSSIHQFISAYHRPDSARGQKLTMLRIPWGLLLCNSIRLKHCSAFMKYIIDFDLK